MESTAGADAMRCSRTDTLDGVEDVHICSEAARGRRVPLVIDFPIS